MKFPVFDGHNDTITQIYHTLNTDQARSFFTKSEFGSIDYPRAMEGGLTGGFFAIFVKNPTSDGWDGSDKSYYTPNSYDIPLPPELDQQYAQEFTDTIIEMLFSLEREEPGKFKVVRTVDELKATIGTETMSGILHFEGVEMLHPDLSNLQHYYDVGLRSLGPVWSRSNAFGHGVPFAFPKSPDTGPGLTDAGKELIKACNKMGILVDLSHMNEKGFWDIESISDKPLVATHSAAFALCNSTRNLTDKQIDAIKASNGVVGVNYCKNFLREDGNPETPTNHTEIVRHTKYLVNRMGIDCVALGSDYDGAKMPHDLSSAHQLPTLIQSLQNEGFSDDELMKITHGNWVRVLGETWK